jgi:hypothetical protein
VTATLSHNKHLPTSVPSARPNEIAWQDSMPAQIALQSSGVASIVVVGCASSHLKFSCGALYTYEVPIIVVVVIVVNVVELFVIVVIVIVVVISVVVVDV